MKDDNLRGQEPGVGYVPNVSGLRGLCAGLVVVLHIFTGAREANWLAQPNSATTNLLWFFVSSFRNAVELFFLISGLLIIVTIRKHNSLALFASNRFWRIYPTHILLTSVIFFGGQLLSYKLFKGLSRREEIELYITNIMTLPGIFDIPAILGVAWSLSYELLFYIVAGVFFAARYLPKALVAAIGTIAVALIVIRYPIGIFFAAGALVYVMTRTGVKRILPGGSVVGGVCVLVAISMFLVLCEMATRSVSPVNYVYFGLSFVLGAAILWCLVVDKGSATAMLRLPAMQYLGKISYGLYMWHTLVEFFVKRIVSKIPMENGVMKTIILGCALIPISIVVSDLNWRIVETWLPRKIRYWHAERRARDVAERAASSRHTSLGHLTAADVCSAAHSFDLMAYWPWKRTAVKHRAGSRWLYILAAISIAVMIASEIVLRTVLGLGYPVTYTVHEEFGYFPSANLQLRRFGVRVETNEYGMRSPSLKTVPVSTCRVMFLGDSVTFGTTRIDQQDIFPSLVSGGLQAAGETDIVLNVASPGWAPQNILGYIDKNGIFDAGLVIIVINSKDLTQGFARYQASYVFPRHRPVLALEELVLRYALPIAFPQFAVVDPGSTEASGPPSESDIIRTASILHQIAGVVSRGGARSILVFVPSFTYEIRTAQATWDSAMQRVQDAVRTDFTSIVDLSDEMRGRGMQTVYQDGIHLTSQGHRIVAAAISNEIAHLGGCGARKT